MYNVVTFGSCLYITLWPYPESILRSCVLHPVHIRVSGVESAGHFLLVFASRVWYCYYKVYNISVTHRFIGTCWSCSKYYASSNYAQYLCLIFMCSLQICTFTGKYKVIKAQVLWTSLKRSKENSHAAAWLFD